MSNSEVEKVLEVEPSTARPEAPKDIKDSKENGVGTWLQIVGVLVGIFGGFAGVIVGFGSGDRGDTNWSLGLPIMISCAITCLLFFGFAEIIFLLEKIAHNTSK